MERYEEEYEEPFGSYLSSFSAFFPKRKRKEISYFVSQPEDMPLSASIIDLKGDGRCLPNIKILIYLIPLQITGCMLVSVFNCGWRNDEGEMDLIKNYYQILKPDDTIERIKEIGPFASQKAIESITNIVQKRVDLLERELKEVKGS